MEFLRPLSSQWQISFFVLAVIMGVIVWRSHREISRLAATSSKMAEHMDRLARTVETIEGQTTNTEHTLIANLSEYRMAMGNTSAYRDYLQKLGVAPASDVEPILEAIPDGAVAIGKDGRILYVNRAMYDATGLLTGMSLQDMVRTCRVRALDGTPLDIETIPEARALRGEDVHEALIRLRPESYERDVILSMNGSPVRDVIGRVVAAVMVGRTMSEEVALAVEVRQRTDAELARATVPAREPRGNATVTV